MNTEAGMVLVWGCGYIAEAIAPWFGVVAALGDEAQGFGQAGVSPATTAHVSG